MWIADSWKDYQVLDTSDGEKLEIWGGYKLIRPDPQVIWKTPRGREWKNPNAHYHRSSKGGGEWEFFDLPQEWTIRYSADLINQLDRRMLQIRERIERSEEPEDSSGA